MCPGTEILVKEKWYLSRQVNLTWSDRCHFFGKTDESRQGQVVGVRVGLLQKAWKI